MNSRSKILALALGLAITGTSIGTAAADTPWQSRHPWREQVNHRLVNLNRRINAERREGELAPRQVRALHREDRTILRQERFMAGQPPDRRRSSRAQSGGEWAEPPNRPLNRSE
jgi:hypothetical protein